MAKSLKKRGQKFLDKFSRASLKASEEGKDHLKKNFFKRLSHISNIKLLILEWGLLVLVLLMLAITQSLWFKDSYSENAFTGGGIYTEATIGEVNSLNPLFATTSSEKTLSRLLFATLSANDYSGKTGIGLASSITPTDNGKIWKIKLRDGLKWSDGVDITNADVLFTVDLIKNPATSTIYDSNLSNVRVTENEDGEIIFNLPSAYADFISALNIPIVPKHILENTDPKSLIENDFSKTPVTSGAFVFNAIQSGASLDEKIFYLNANPNYYKGKTMLNGFSIHTYGEKKKIIEALNSGAITATAELSEIDSKEVSSNFLRRNSSLNSGAFIFFNVTSGPTDNLALRKAIRQGIDIGRLREEALETMPLDYPILSSQINLTEYPTIPSYDFDAAKNKVAKISNGETIKLNIATVDYGFLPKISELLADELGSLGIEANVSIYNENQDFIKDVISERNYDILVYEIELGADPDLLPYYHSSQATTTGLNLSNYHNNLVDDLLLGARDTTNQALRIRKYETFLNYWVSDVPSIALYRPNLTYYYNRNMRTFNDSVKIVTVLDRFCDINNWAVNKSQKDKTP